MGFKIRCLVKNCLCIRTRRGFYNSETISNSILLSILQLL